MLDHPDLGIGLFIYVALGGGIGFLWLYRFCKWDRPSAWFAAFPGGMSEMIASAEAFGANIPKVALSHSLRIFCLVCGASLASYFFAGITTGSLGFGEADWTIQPLVFLTMVVSVWGGKYLRIPAHSFMAPMFASLTMNLMFDIQLRLTDLILISGQYFLGWSIASRFKGVSKNEVVMILKQVFVLLLLFLPIWGMMAVLLDQFTDIDLASIILGLAPGGQAEIALIAMASKREPGRGHDTPRAPLANDYDDWPNRFRAHHKIKTQEAFKCLMIRSKKESGTHTYPNPSSPR